MKKVFAPLPLLATFILSAQQGALYSVGSVGYEDGRIEVFISLTDSYRWSDHEDSLLVDDKYLRGLDSSIITYKHELEEDYRDRFLLKIGIQETDSVFIYNIQLDELIRFRVADIAIVAWPSIYEPKPPFEQWAFQAGIQLDPNYVKGKDNFYHTSFAAIGPVNPFVRKGMVPIEWTIDEVREFPWNQSTLKKKYKNTIPDKVHSAVVHGMKFYVQNEMLNEFIASRHVMVVDQKNGNILFDGYFNDSEGTYREPLNRVEELPERNLQWTGYLLKNKPPIVYGFLSHSFGCPSINFLKPSEPAIWLRCDNRH